MITMPKAPLFLNKKTVSMMSILKRIPLEEISIATRTIWHDKAIANKIAQDTDELISQAYKRKFAFFNGKSSKCIVGGLFYIMGYRYDSIKKQRELADKLDTTDVTIRASYKQWLETFPDLFEDVIEKLAQNEALRYYILVNLKPNTPLPQK
jgi:transcription initiation factor TFIIIB Brf1 subunit/transcription initiation factor TFIIB